MFKVEFFIDDKNLPAMLHTINGKVMNLSVVPVVNAVPVKTRGPGKANGKITQDSEHLLGLFCKELKKLAKEEIKAADVKEALTKIGKSPTSYSHFLARAVDAGLIKKGERHGNSFSWAWV